MKWTWKHANEITLKWTEKKKKQRKWKEDGKWYCKRQTTTAHFDDTSHLTWESFVENCNTSNRSKSYAYSHYKTSNGKGTDERSTDETFKWQFGYFILLKFSFRSLCQCQWTSKDPTKTVNVFLSNFIFVLH